jgi:signal transduction histidine kinase
MPLSIRRYFTEPRVDRALHALAALAALAGIALVVTGVLHMLRPVTGEQALESDRARIMLGLGHRLTEDIARVVRPAIQRTQRIAADPDVLRALRAGDAPLQTARCNQAVTSGTEIDALALFDAKGRITAINSVYADGRPIPRERVDRIMNMNFDGRDIIGRCISNTAADKVLEFQITCDITPAFFDSTGLSVAISVPVVDPATGERVGVASSRLRFDRLLSLLDDSLVAGDDRTVKFVTDDGQYFDEQIRAGTQLPPVPIDAVAAAVKPLLDGHSEFTLTRVNDSLVIVNRLREFSTLSGGGIQVLTLVDEASLAQTAATAAKHRGWAILAAGLLFSLPAGVAEAAVWARRRSRRTRSLIESAMDAYFATDAQGIVTDCNSMAASLVGRPAQDLIGRPLLSVLPLRVAGGDPVSDVAALLPRDHTAVQAMLALPDQPPREVEVSASTTTAHGGRWFSLFVRDVASQRRLERQVNQSQKLQSIGQLAAGIAHEINTPTQYVSDNMRFLRDQFASVLRIVDFHAQMLDPAAEPMGWEQRRERLNALIAETDFDFLRTEIPLALDQSLEGLSRVTRIIGAMKEFSHPGSAIKEATDLNQAIRSTAIICANRWKYVADLDFDLDPALPHVPCLAAELNQVLLNLIVNAADAIAEHRPKDRGKGRIRISTCVRADHAEIRVEDDGGGIPEHVQPRIFEPFFTTKDIGKGTGQGLAICRDVIVNRHGGSIEFQTTPGSSTTFVVRLPLAAQQPMREAA